MKSFRRIFLIAFLVTSSFSLAESKITRAKKWDRNLKTFRLLGQQVLGKGKLDLVPEFVTAQYIRPEGNEARVVSNQEYASEIEANLGTKLLKP